MTATTKVTNVRSLPDKSSRGEGRRRGRGAGENTAEEIRSVALDLFYKRGFQATTLRDIAAKVGIQVGSLYNHIASKGDLLFEIMENIMLDLLEDQRKVAETPDVVEQYLDGPELEVRLWDPSTQLRHRPRRAREPAR